MLEWIVLAAIPMIGLILVAICIRLDWKQKHPPICDTCARLVCKDAGFRGKYRCGRCGTFSRPPEICAYYEPKEEADHADRND